ncbi:MAG: glycoside hydrolase family 97 N-terminal domain-containing protein [Bacteroidota bacterium]
MRLSISILFSFCLLLSYQSELVIDESLVTSPNEHIKVAFGLDKGKAYYQVRFQNEVVIDTSYLGFEFIEDKSLGSNLEVLTVDISTYSETWEMPWGEQREVQNNYNQLTINLKEQGENGRRISVVYKVYDDGLGFRYEIPEQDGWSEVLIKDEHTEFNLTQDYKTFWIPGDWDIYEHLYSTTKLSEIDAKSYIERTNLAQSYIPENAVNTPVTMVGENGLHLSFHEASLVDYAGMTLKVDTENLNLKSNLVGSRNTGL